MVLDILLKSQKAFLRKGSTVIGDYTISSSKFGTGEEPGSFKTPTGRFKIHQKIGAGEKKYTIFQVRKSVGTWDKTPTEKDLILSRIIWLEGLDSHNENTVGRHIYLHGTNQEDQLGVPASWGCIRFKNEDIIHLFEQIKDDVEIIIRP